MRLILVLGLLMMVAAAFGIALAKPADVDNSDTYGVNAAAVARPSQPD